MTTPGTILKQIINFDVGGWRQDAACRGMDTNLFFEDAETNEDRARAYHQREQAKRICATCTVKEECLNFALENKLDYGIYGGLTYRNRLKVRGRIK